MMLMIASQILLCLLIATVLGAILGWLLKSMLSGAPAYDQGLIDEHQALMEENKSLITARDNWLHEKQALQAECEKQEALAQKADLERLTKERAEWDAERKKITSDRDRLMEKLYDMEASASSKAVGDGDAPKDEYHVTEIEGIGKGYGKRLEAEGMRTTTDLLKVGHSEGGKERIAKAVKGMDAFVIEKWLSMADLVRVPGIRGQFAELLEASGVKSAKALATQDAARLTDTMIEVNKRENRTRTNPNLEMVQNWVARAGEL